MSGLVWLALLAGLALVLWVRYVASPAVRYRRYLRGGRRRMSALSWLLLWALFVLVVLAAGAVIGRSTS